MDVPELERQWSLYTYAKADRTIVGDWIAGDWPAASVQYPARWSPSDSCCRYAWTDRSGFSIHPTADLSGAELGFRFVYKCSGRGQQYRISLRNTIFQASAWLPRWDVQVGKRWEYAWGGWIRSGAILHKMCLTGKNIFTFDRIHYQR